MPDSTRPMRFTFTWFFLFAAVALLIASAWFLRTGLASSTARIEELAMTREASEQLLRIQTNLNTVGKGVAENLSQGRPISGLPPALATVRKDLDAAVTAHVAALPGGEDQQALLSSMLAQFWTALDRVATLSRDGHEAEAREQLARLLQPQLSGGLTTVGFMLLENNESQARASMELEAAHRHLQQRLLACIAGALAALAATALTLSTAKR